MFAIIFPGQGSQKPGMGKDLYDHGPVARTIFERVSSAIGRDVAELCFASDEETLRQTQNAQIALYTCGVAAWEELASRIPDLVPSAMAGHSVGEYAALAAAQVFSVEDGAKLVQLRGELMAESGRDRPGTMAAVLGLERVQLEQVCKEASTQGIAVIANDNCPGQLVISGDMEGIRLASELASAAGAKRVLPLNVSGAFHSPLMEAPASRMAEALAEVTFRPPQAMVISNVTAHEETSGWPQLLEQQLKSPVRWTESVLRMRTLGIGTFFECGSGEVLCGLIRRIDREAVSVAVQDVAGVANALEVLSPAGTF
jgi:[acyl-carrier-protein] S-malonyltransferase